MKFIHEKLCSGVIVVFNIILGNIFNIILDTTFNIY